MNDAENIISQIEQVLNSPEQTPMPQLQTIASQYAARCKELNDSMILVLNNIYANNYCEAVRAADEQHVLDDYNVLNFPGLSEWKQVCATLGLAKPADLAEDLAEKINELYESQTPLLPIQRLHRKLSVSRAPLRDRLKVLYKLDSLEPTNLNWSQMISELEPCRDKEITADYQAKCKTGISSEDLQKIYSELSGTGRKTDPPQALFQEVKTKIEKINREKLIAEYRAKTQLLLKAYHEMDYQGVVRQFESIRDSLSQDKISFAMLPNDIQGDVNLVHIWMNATKRHLSKQAEFDAKVAQLKRALESNVDFETLDQIYHSLELASESLEIPIPSSLENAYQRELRTVETQKRRRLVVIIVAVVFVCLLFAGLVALLTMNRKNEVKQTQNVRQLETHENFTEADFVCRMPILSGTAEEDCLDRVVIS